MRATIHNARTGKNGAFLPCHNDRDFDTRNAEHINPDYSPKNFYWHCMLPEHPEMSFEGVERRFYEIHCQDHLNAKNAKYTAQRHHERVRTMDKYRTAPQTCPEETLLMIGKKGDTISPRMLKHICSELIAWEEITFPGVHVLDIALHVDEEGAPHLHERKVWLYTDKNGHEAVGQNQVLEKLGIPLPHPDRPRGRYNNRKQIYSKMVREKFLQICQEHGLEIEEKPKESSRSGRTLEDYRAEQAAERANDLHAFAANQTKAINNLQREERQLERRIYRKGVELENMDKQLQEMEGQMREVWDFLHLAEQRRAFEIFCDRERERSR